MNSSDRARVLARLPYQAGWRDDDEDDVRWDEEDDLGPAPPLNLSRPQRVELAAAITAALQQRGCDNTLRAAQSWTAGAGLDWSAVQAGLQGRGGYCDCEVLLNVDLAT